MGFSWMRYLGRNYWKWEFEQLFQGHRSMAKKNPSLNELRLVLISGPITSLIVAALWSPLLFFGPTLAFGIIAVGANMLYALGSILPTKHYQNGENQNDGTYLLMSYREPQKLQRLIKIHYDRIAEWLRPSGYNLSPVSLSDKPNEDCASNLFWYWKLEDQGKVAEAEPYLRSALEIAKDNPKPESYIIEACYEAAVYYRRRSCRIDFAAARLAGRRFPGLGCCGVRHHSRRIVVGQTGGPNRHRYLDKRSDIEL